VIECSGLGKTYRVPEKQTGRLQTLKHLLARKYRDVPAVVDAGFRIEKGEIVGFLGPNGAGKTTTLKMLAGLLKPSSGSVVVFGHEPFKRPKAFLKQITLVMGNKQQLLWDLPAQDSLRINAAVYEIPPREVKGRIDELADLLDVSKLLSIPVRKLSLGERMKCELLASLLHRPEVLFLDEPTLGLDVNAQANIRAFIAHYNQTYGATVLLTSHYMADITALCPRVMLIDKGRLGFDGLLTTLTARHTPYRDIVMELAHAQPTLPNVGAVIERVGLKVRLRVPAATIAAAMSTLLAEVDVVDVSVVEPPIEEVIGAIFSGKTTATAPALDVHR
jgi:ABC-2 type transport system ATP-binding protein